MTSAVVSKKFATILWKLTPHCWTLNLQWSRH